MNFFNDSFKTLKSALEEKINNFEDPEESFEENENLKKLVQHQNDEIDLLRKQIFEYQQTKLNDTRTLLDTDRRRTSSTSQQQSNQNESWFWEPETSSAASKDGAELADLTTIPLEANDHEVIEKLRLQISDRESKVKSLNVENAVLNEKLKHLNAENQQLNKSIEELDSQHQVAIEKVLEVKTTLQEKFTIASAENEKFKVQIKKYYDTLDTKDAENSELKSRLEKQKENSSELMEIAKKYEQQIEKLTALNTEYEEEIAELKNTPEQVAIVSNDECLRKINTLLNNSFKLGEEYIDEEHFTKTFTAWMSSTSAKFREMDFEISKLIDENKHIKDEAAKHTLERDALKSELINYEIECTELLKSNNILMADIENLRTSGIGKLETIMENDGDDEEADGFTYTSALTAASKSSNVDEEFSAIKSKLEATEVERGEYLDQIQTLKNQLSENVTRCKSYQQEIDNLENEKCNYLFELNELKSEEERNILQKELKCAKERELELSKRLDEVEKEKEEFVRRCNELQCSTDAISTQTRTLEEKENELTKALSEMERLHTMSEQLNELESVKLEMLQRLRDNEEALQQLKNERDSLEQKCEELSKTYNSNLESLQKSNQQVQELQQKLLETSVADELNVKISNLEESVSSLRKERDDLKVLHDESLLNFEKVKNQLENSSVENDLKLTIMQLEESLENIKMKKEELQEKFNLNLENLQKSIYENEALEKKASSVTDEFNSKITLLENSIEALNNEKLELQKCYEINLENLKKSNEQIEELQRNLSHSTVVDELKLKISTLEESVEALTKEKDNLVMLVTTKHNENVQYHNEILRLNQILQHDEKREFENEELSDQIKFLREKCDLLAQNLLQEQNNYRLLQQEKNDAAEMNNTLNKDIERLRQHLLEVADAYTFEQVSLQKQVDDYRDKLMSVEAEAKQSSTAYTSASIRANQHAETLQSQYNLLVQQRDELLMKISASEDKDNKNQAALTNLQIALEIFQRDKENDIEFKTAALHKELDGERAHQARLRNDISQLQSQLQEAKNGLMAAARLSDQLELNQLTIDKLNNEISSYQSTIQSLKKQLEDSNANTSNADIDLIKNLILGYITANANSKTQILKLIANVLNLNDAECIKVGLKSSSGGGGGGWFSRGGNDNLNDSVSLTEAFVAFLEKESTPRVNPNLLTIHENDTTSATAVRKSSMESSSSSNMNVASETPVPIMLSDNNSLLTPYTNQNSSSILKDLLHDT